ncbi:MAG: adenylosuccinate lyase [Alphaproteobacteria bacterium]|nr:adenylosuccinate lyase [Alphaproteobacteria bacterium]MDE2337053.1 adenylosuccinate lyase [Alphaproteobacteria bacterium]
MIPRFSRPEMTSIWEIENKFKIWLEVEMLICEAQAELGVIPKDAPEKIRKKAKFDVKRIDEIEKKVHHDVIAFLTSVGEHVGDEARYIHVGVTSSDVIDTGFSVQLRQAADLIIADLDRLLMTLRHRVLEYKDTICIGRSHGIHAEPTTFGMKLAGHYAAFSRAKLRMVRAREEISTCAISGPVGTYASIDPRVEAYVAEKLGLVPEPVSTQVIPRDRHAMFFATLGVIASSIENLATEIRHLQRTEVREAEEYFAPEQKGSSAMPHKRNPVLSENLTGLARLVRASVTPALEDVTLWHERDISHSSVERVIAPDATILLDFALHRLGGVMDKLLVYPKRMKENLEKLRGLVFSQHVLLALTQGGMSRDYAYRLVQEHAMKVWDNEDLQFFNLLDADDTVDEYIEPEVLKNIFNYRHCIERTADVIDRVLEEK